MSGAQETEASSAVAEGPMVLPEPMPVAEFAADDKVVKWQENLRKATEAEASATEWRDSDEEDVVQAWQARASVSSAPAPAAQTWEEQAAEVELPLPASPVALRGAVRSAVSGAQESEASLAVAEGPMVVPEPMPVGAVAACGRFVTVQALLR